MKKLLFVLFAAIISHSAFSAEVTYIYSCSATTREPRDTRYLRIRVEKNTEGKFIKLNSIAWFLHSRDAAEGVDPVGPFRIEIIEVSEKGSIMPTPHFRVYVNDWVRGYIHPNTKISTLYESFGEIFFPHSFITENQRTGWAIESDEQKDGSLKVYIWNCWDPNAPVPAFDE